ncbi:MAG: HU family DNA-binding protein [Bacteroidaceae bacterium]|nr:HU family DNA-binding protein [Bacteroidaceae bacterium]
MRKTKATKKSGTIAYQLNPRYDLQGEATEKNPLMGVSVVPMPPVTTKEMAERIGYATSVNKTDVVAVLSALGHELSQALLDGRTVRIDEIGSFNVKLGMKALKYLNDRVTQHDIEVKGISFRPCKELKESLRSAEIVSGGHAVRTLLTRDIAERRLRNFFEDNDYIYRSQMEQLCECSTYLATKYLNLFVKEGRLRALGRKNSRFYAPASEGF